MSSELPDHLEAVRAAVLDDLPEEPLIDRNELNEIRAELVARLQGVAEQVSAGTALQLNHHVLPKALECAASISDEPFEWSAPFANRSIGLPALGRVLKAERADIPVAVSDTIDDEIEQKGSLGVWLSSLGPPGLAAVCAAATGWTSRAWTAVPWLALGTVRLNPTASWYRPLGYDTPIILRPRPDAFVLIRGPRAQERVLLRLGPPNEAVTRMDALAAALESGRAPLRAVVVQPSSGRTEAWDINGALFQLGIEDVVRAAQQLIPMETGGLPPEIPGSWCRWCYRQDACSTGTSWIATQDRRIAGIPLR